MRDHKRIDRILEHVRTFWKENPDWRLGQLVVNAASGVMPNHYVAPCPRCGHPTHPPHGTAGLNIFSMEDETFEAGLDKLEENINA